MNLKNPYTYLELSVEDMDIFRKAARGSETRCLVVVELGLTSHWSKSEDIFIYFHIEMEINIYFDIKKEINIYFDFKNGD